METATQSVREMQHPGDKSSFSTVKIKAEPVNKIQFKERGHKPELPCTVTAVGEDIGQRFIGIRTV